PAPAAELDKYLLDDTDFVLSMNVKQVLSSPAFTKHYQKQVDGLLKMEPVQRVLKDSGFDPLKDVDRLMLAMGKSGHQVDIHPNPRGPTGPASGPILPLQGRFDPAKLQAKAEQLRKDFPQLLKPHQVGAAQVYEIHDGPRFIFFVALVDKTTLVAAPRKN